MKSFKNLKVAFKVLLSCAILIILLVVSIFFSISSMRSIQASIKDYRENSVLAVIKMDNIAKNILQGRVNAFMMEKALARGDNTELKKLADDTQKIREENLELLKFIKERNMTDEEKTLTVKYEEDYILLGTKMKGYTDALNTADKVRQEAALADWSAQIDVVITRLKDLQSVTLKYGGEKIGYEFARMDRTMIIMFIILVFSITAGVVITIILSRSVSIPVNKGLEFAQRIADGDLTDRIDLNQEDELGLLARALNQAADNLEKLVSEVNLSVQNLTMAVNDISSGNQNLSQRTTEQASSLEEIASTLEETTSTIKLTADNTLEANKIADSSSKLAVNGGLIVESTVNSMNMISDSGKRIGDIIAVINEIAFQTNLLALNAAVEAARAGEQGRGFAVVASEVRNLAQRAGSSAKEIEVLIKETTENINQGTDLVNKSGQALKEIITSVKEVGRIISEVTAATEEQRQGIEQINAAVMDLDSMTQQNAALVEETASASEEMANQAQELIVVMKQFKVKEDERIHVVEPSSRPGISKKTTQEKDHHVVHVKPLGARKETQAAGIKKEAPAAAAPATGTKDTGGVKKHLEDEGFEAF